LGNQVELVKSRVNSDVDKCTIPINVESASCVKGVVTDVVGPNIQINCVPSKVVVAAGDKGDAGSDVAVGVEDDAGSDVAIGDKGDAGILGTHGDSGPAQLGTCSQIGWTEEEGGCRLKDGDFGGPTVLRTRNGDLTINGPVILPSLEGPNEGMCVEGWGVKARFANTSCSHISETQFETPGEADKIPQRESFVPNSHHRSRGVTKRLPSNRNITNPPFSMLRKLPGSYREKSIASSKKRSRKVGGRRRRGEAPACSDPIQSSELDCSQQHLATEAPGGINLEIVLPFHSAEVERPQTQVEVGGEDINHSPVANSSSATESQLEGGGFVVDNSIMAEDPVVSREEYEAGKLIDIGEELGIQFQGSIEEFVVRMVEMEARDRKEKQDWESQMGLQ
jgi:hypothetical protein